MWYLLLGYEIQIRQDTLINLPSIFQYITVKSIFKEIASVRTLLVSKGISVFEPGRQLSCETWCETTFLR